MRIRTRRIIALAIAALAIAGCSSNNGQTNANADSSVSTPSSTEETTDDGTFEPEASLEPDPTSLDAELATPTHEPEPTRTPEVDSDVARAADLVPCEAALSLDVINVTVPGTAEAFLRRVIVNNREPRLLYSETCVYTVRTAAGYFKGVAYVTSSQLTDTGKEFYQNTCADGLMNSDDLVGKRIGYQYYRNIDDGCTFAPKSTAPSGVLPGFVLRYRDKMVTVRLQGFDKVASDGEAVIREVELKRES